MTPSGRNVDPWDLLARLADAHRRLSQAERQLSQLTQRDHRWRLSDEELDWQRRQVRENSAQREQARIDLRNLLGEVQAEVGKR